MNLRNKASAFMTEIADWLFFLRHLPRMAVLAWHEARQHDRDVAAGEKATP